MNKKLLIDKQGEEWIAFLVEYDPLPFGNYKDTIEDSFKKKSFPELMQEIGNRNWIDYLNKNE